MKTLEFELYDMVIIPEPEEGDSWEYGMISRVEDIEDNGDIYFCDDYYELHRIEGSRVKPFQK